MFFSGVFGAGKTRSAAALLAGLLVFDPSLQLMVLTKENIAAHAVAEHLVSLQMPDYLQDKMGRFFFLISAALVIATVAVMKLC